MKAAKTNQILKIRIKAPKRNSTLKLHMKDTQKKKNTREIS